MWLRLNLVQPNELELNFHILNANSQSFARAKSEAKMAAQGGKFWTSVSVLFAVLYLSFSPCTTLICSFCLTGLRKHSQPWKKCLDEILLDQFYIIEYLKGFIIAVWPKKCTQLSEDGKLTVKRNLHSVVSSSNFSRPFYQVSRQFGNLFS